MPKLNWISDHHLTQAVQNILIIAKKAKMEVSLNFGKNVVDPFSAIFEMAGFNLNYDNWIVSEEARQAQKTLQNFIGEFHQIILGSCVGWEDLKKGNIIDLLSHNNKIIAEVKNKYNTISGGKLAELYWSLEPAVMNKTSIYKGYTAYYVSIIPDKPGRYNKTFTPSNKEKGQKCPENNLIRQIDGASFYTLVTGEVNALQNLFNVLPAVISEIGSINTLEKDKLGLLFKMAYGQFS
jgi:hypothetical protein